MVKWLIPLVLGVWIHLVIAWLRIGMERKLNQQMPSLFLLLLLFPDFFWQTSVLLPSSFVSPYIANLPSSVFLPCPSLSHPSLLFFLFLLSSCLTSSPADQPALNYSCTAFGVDCLPKPEVHGFSGITSKNSKGELINEIFQRQLRDGLTEGASVAVWIGDELVMSLSGGRAHSGNLSDSTTRFYDKVRCLFLVVLLFFFFFSSSSFSSSSFPPNLYLFFLSISKDTLQVIFSSGKSLEAVAMAILVEQGHIKYDDPISKVWPEFSEGGKASVTLTELLRHEGGMAFFTDQEPVTPEDILNRIEEGKIRISLLSLSLSLSLTPNLDISSSLLFLFFVCRWFLLLLLWFLLFLFSVCFIHLYEVDRRLAKNAHTNPGERGRIYHALMRGIVLDAIVRRVDPKNRDFSTFFKEEISIPLNIQDTLHVKLDEELASSSIISPFIPEQLPRVITHFALNNVVQKVLLPPLSLTQTHSFTHAFLFHYHTTLALSSFLLQVLYPLANILRPHISPESYSKIDEKLHNIVRPLSSSFADMLKDISDPTSTLWKSAHKGIQTNEFLQPKETMWANQAIYRRVGLSSGGIYSNAESVAKGKANGTPCYWNFFSTYSF
jgi:hypothetical protein